jgi:hypothetical protein
MLTVKGNYTMYLKLKLININNKLYRCILMTQSDMFWFITHTFISNESEVIRIQKVSQNVYRGSRVRIRWWRFV